MPAYFSYDVILNKTEAKPFLPGIEVIEIGKPVLSEYDFNCLDKSIWIVDFRNQQVDKNGHLPYSVNLMTEMKFETWLGSIIQPHEPFYLTGDDDVNLLEVIKRTAAIGYETQIVGAFVIGYTNVKMGKLNVEKFSTHQQEYTIIDVRNRTEVRDHPIFENSLNIPLAELRGLIGQIPLEKPLVVHCTSGFRSAAGSSIIQSSINNKAKVFDLGEAIKVFLPQEIDH